MYKIIKLKEVIDESGALIIGELGAQIPFVMKRFYFLKSLKNRIARGFHAHHKCRQVAVCLQGSLEMHFDNGIDKDVYTMKPESEALTIEPYVWHEMHEFSEDCILLVLASDEYDEGDYIRSYADFKKYVGEL